MQGEYLRVGGIEQWVEVHAGPPARPILLFLHGGPGASSRPAAQCWAPWTEHYSVVHWDQRGCGRTLRRNGEEGCGRLSIGRMVQDGLELAQLLGERLHNDRLILMGHSWGSVLGVEMVDQRPDLFLAYVGTGQLVNKQRNEHLNHLKLMATALRTGNVEGYQALRALSGPLHLSRTAVTTLREWGDRLAPVGRDALVSAPDPRNPNFSPEDQHDQQRGRLFSRDQLFDEVAHVALDETHLDFEVPVLLLHGTADPQCPIELVEEYFERLTAPAKALVRFEGCHHFTVMNRPQEVLEALLKRIPSLPAISGQAGR
jgi:pimeloyl-ACP methyl ester carboxylesterase